MMAISQFTVFVASYLICGPYCGASGTNKKVYFSLIISGGENGYHSSGGIPSVDMALKAVAKMEILPGYNLTYKDIQNSKCTRTDSLDVFFKDTQLGAVPKIAVVGCGCSTATEPVAEISHYWNITHISFAAALSSLSDRSRFRYYFRTTPSFANYAPAILGVLNNFNWKQIAFITESQNLFLKIVTDFQQLLQSLQDGRTDLCCFRNHKIEADSAIFEDNGDPVAAATKIFDQRRFHVFMLNCYSKFSRKILCEALKRGYLYPHYGWILYGWYPERWWTEEVAGEHIDECTDKQLEVFLRKSRPLIIHLLPEPDDFHQTTDAGISTNEFIHNYTHILRNSEYSISTVYIIAFDTIWSLALMLKKTEEMRNATVSRKNSEFEKCNHLYGELVPLDEFNYSNAFMGCVMKENFYKVNFTGVSGPVRYDENGTIIYTRIRLSQYREENGTVSLKRFGYLDRDSNFALVYEAEESDKTLYPDGFPPDGTPITVVQGPHTALVIVYYTVALCGILLSIVFLIFNFLYRNRKVIRLTTPLLSYIIISGAILMYLSVFLGLLKTTEKVVIQIQCNVHVWLYGVGYLLVYGTLLAKMWRVYQIFHNPNPNKSILKTWHLVCVVCAVTGVGILLILARTVAQALTDPTLVTNRENPEGATDSDIREDYKVWQCYGSGSAPFSLDLVIYVYLGLLQVVGIILAFQTRKVKIPVLNDSKSVTALIYISSIVLVVILLVTFILNGYVNVTAVLFHGGILSLATIFLALIFIPKMISLYRDPKGEEIFSDIDPSKRTEKSEIKDNHNSMVASLSVLKDSEKVVLLNSQVARLKETLNDKNKRIAELEGIVNSTN